MQSVLVVVGYTDYKYMTRPLYPEAFNQIEYPHKKFLFVDENLMPDILEIPTGDRIAAEIRARGIEEAVNYNFDWVLFLDVDLIPDPDILTKLLSMNYPFVGGVTCARKNNRAIIGHYYESYKTLERLPIVPETEKEIIGVNGISGAMMLVHRDIFTKVDYKGYTGVNHIPGRTTCDDEWYCLEVYRKTGIIPKMHMGANSWHLDDNGLAYRYGEKPLPYKKLKNKIIFRGKEYEQDY